MKFYSNNFARSLGLSATFNGDICEPEDKSVGINGNSGYIVNSQIGEHLPNTPNTLFLDLARAVTAAYEFWEMDKSDTARDIEAAFDNICEMVFGDDYPDPEPDYSPESGDLPFFPSYYNE